MAEKPDLALLLTPKKSKEDGGEDEEDVMAELEVAMEDLIAAVKDGDAAAAAAAFKAGHTICQGYSEE